MSGRPSKAERLLLRLARLTGIAALLAPRAVLVPVARLLTATGFRNVRDASRPAISHDRLLVAGFAACTRCYGLAADSTTETSLKPGSDVLVRSRWETPAAPDRWWAWFSLLLADGPGCYPGRPHAGSSSTSRGRPTACPKASGHGEGRRQAGRAPVHETRNGASPEPCFQSPEISLRGRSSTVEVAELLRMTLRARLSACLSRPSIVVAGG